MPYAMPMTVGEVVDRYWILIVKTTQLEKAGDSDRLKIVKEYSALFAKAMPEEILKICEEEVVFFSVHEKLWHLESIKRALQREFLSPDSSHGLDAIEDGDVIGRVIQLVKDTTLNVSKMITDLNDYRSKLKREIDAMYDSLYEVKSY